MAVAKKAVPKELLDSLLADYRKPEDLIGENGLLKQLTKLLVEKALEAEMADHLGHGKNEPVENPAGNTRNGKSRKTLKGEFGELPIEIPRDRHGTFEPQLIPKHQTRWTGFDDKILSLWACKNFCVNGHLAGNCRAPRSDDGRSKESSTEGVAGQPAG